MNKRTRRVAGLLKEEISAIIARDLKNPDIGIVTITEVKVSEDLKHAKVYASIMGEEAERLKGLAGLEHSCSFIRSGLASRTSLRYIPEIRFVCDDTLDYANKIDSLLHQIQNEQKNHGNGDD